MPFLSVVVPTRNRPECLRSAVRSVLAQEFRDFELVVSDNSDESAARQNLAFLKEIGDPRLRHVRPDQVLSMTEHWNWAVAHASGSYVGVLTDRMVYKRGEMAVVDETLRTHEPPVLAFRWDRLAGARPPFRFSQRSYTGRASWVRSEEVLRRCAASDFDLLFPKMLNSFCERGLLRTLEERYGSIFSSVSPDFSFGFRVLDSVEEFLGLDRPILITAGEGLSNGRALGYNRWNAAGFDFRRQLGQEEDAMARAPIPAVVPIPLNYLMLEYEVARREQRSGWFAEYDKERFYRKAHRKVCQMLERGYRIDDAAQELERFREKNGLAPAGRFPGGLGLRARVVRRALTRSVREALRVGVGHRRFRTVEQALEFAARHPRLPTEREIGT